MNDQRARLSAARMLILDYLSDLDRREEIDRKRSNRAAKVVHHIDKLLLPGEIE